MNFAEKETGDTNQKEVREGFAIGKVINEKYFIEKQLGEGGMGLTYLAHDTENIHRKVVIKTIFKELSTEDGKLAFLKEGEALGRINHDGVVKLFDKGIEIETGLPYLVMEYVNGIPLTDIIKREQMQIENAVLLTEKIAFALTAAHRENVLHRDLKPDNVMVIESDLEDDKIKLIDFGVAKVANSVVGGNTTHLGSFKGTLQYASPEQLNGFQNIEGETYNIALLCYEILTQQKPFPISVERKKDESNASLRGRAFSQLKESQKAGAKNPQIYNPNISNKISEVILKGLEYELTNRYKTPFDFAVSLKESVKTTEKEKKVFFIEPKPKFSIWKLLLPIPIIFLFLALVLLGYFAWTSLYETKPIIADLNTKPILTPTVTPQIAEVLFNYSFDVQKMKDNIIDGEIFASDDLTNIAFGDKFRLKIEREKVGNFYIVKQNGENFDLIFPNNDKNVKKINTWQVSKANQVFWLIWSKEIVDLLESKPINQSQLTDFLRNNQKNIETQQNQGKIEIKGVDNIVVHKLAL